MFLMAVTKWLRARALPCGALCAVVAGISFSCGSLAFAGDSLIPFAVRGVAYPAASMPLPASPCLYARDLPLIAAMGANTIRTYSLPPEGDRTFLAVLESTGLNWLAGFPLEPYYDPAVSIGSRRHEILSAFRHYVLRFRGHRRVLGYVFGNDVPAGYARKFAGAPGEFFALLADAAAVLRESDPDRTPLLTTAVSNPAEMVREVPAISFWSWNAGTRTSFGPALLLARSAASRPVLVSEFGPSASDEKEAALSAAAMAAEVEPSDSVLGAIYASFDMQNGLFSAFLTPKNAPTLLPRPVFYRLAGIWGGTFPPAWKEAQPPRLEPPDTAPTPGAVVRFSGAALTTAAAPYTDEAWPYHLGGICLCVNGLPARLSFVSALAVNAQIPPAVAAGPATLVLYRAGKASNVKELRVSELSAGASSGPIIEARLRH